ncbi:MAG: hypothetical protein IPL32_06245 [Chloracidobacterium sp.]|nr:hypothetical protein [Chloracidobacterium sp.]
MRFFLFFLLIFFALEADLSFAQNGGKAEPLRIEFAKGRTSAVLTRSLSNDQQMEYVFGASKGQTVTIKNTKTSLFDFKVFSEENFSEGDFDSSPTYTFVIPETGDYNLFIRKKRVKSPRTASFSITLSIK